MDADDDAWEDAETRFAKAAKGGLKNPVVSVKVKSKRKAEVSEAPKEENGVSEKRHRKKSKREKK